MKAIQTIYKGHHFRSRTEARWAVFFDAIGIKYQYENEGVMLSTGKYLPDFYLPNFEGGAYAEVKGEATEEEMRKRSELAMVSKKPVLLLEGVPDFRCYYYYVYGPSIECDTCFEPCAHPDNCQSKTVDAIQRIHGIVNTSNKYGERMYSYPGFEGSDLFFNETDWYVQYRDAVYAARSARFEFGQSGATI